MNPNDKRAQKTKNALYGALMELLAEKDISRITIKELTDKADVHRVTFYAHYQDIYELYEEVKERALADFSAFVTSDPSHDYEEYYVRVVDYTYEHRWICQLLFTDNDMLDQVLDVLKDNYLQVWLFEDHLTEITPDMRYMTSYNIEGCTAIIRQWWRGGYHEPKEKIVGYLRRANRIFDAVSLIK